MYFIVKKAELLNHNKELNHLINKIFDHQVNQVALQLKIFSSFIGWRIVQL